MKKVIKFQQKCDFYLDMAEGKYDEGDFIGGITAVKYAIKYAKNKTEQIDAYLLYAIGLSKLGKFNLANKICYKVLSIDSTVTEVLFELAQNYGELNRSGLAEYYLSKATRQLSPSDSSFSDLDNLLSGFKFMNDDEELESDYDNYDDAEDVDIEKLFAEQKKENMKNYKVVYPEPKYKFNPSIARNLLAKGKFDEAIAVLQPVEPDDKNYIEAMNNLFICYLLNNKLNLAKRTIDKLMEVDENNQYTLCNYAVYLQSTRQLDNINPTLEKILLIDDLDPSEYGKVATILCELNRHKEASKYLRLAHEQAPESDTLSILLGLAYFNNHEYDKAIDIFDKILKVDWDNSVAKYYIGYVNKIRSSKQHNVATLPYLTELPYVEMARRLLIIETMVKTDNLNALENVDSEEYACTMWLIENIYNDFVDKLFSEIMLSNFDVDNIANSVMMSCTTPTHFKILAITCKLRNNASSLKFLCDDKFNEITLTYPKNYDKANHTLKNAFRVAVATSLMYFEPNFEILNRMFDYICASQQSGMNFKSAQALTFILIKSSISVNGNSVPFTTTTDFDKELLSTVGATAKTTNKYIEMLELG